MGGFTDYMTLLNTRDGGIAGLKLVWEECETASTTDRAVACYERLKAKGLAGAPVFHPLSSDITTALLERATSDKIPLITLGYGRSDAADGRVFPYLFPLLATDWSQTAAQVRYIAQEVGGEEKLKGLKIVNLHLNVPSGKETLWLWDKLAKKSRFEIKHVAVPLRETEPQTYWQHIRENKPAWVSQRLWNTACTASLREAASAEFPRARILGDWGCAGEEEMIPLGQTVVGYRATNFHGVGSDFPVLKTILDTVYGYGKGNLSRTRVGSVYYNRGVVYGIVTTEALRLAYQHFGGGPIGGEQMQWALEHLHITPERLKELGAEGLLFPLKTSCLDHVGSGAVRVQQWNGEKWLALSEWIAPANDLVQVEVAQAAARYARDKGLTPRDCQ
jgi:branched-chain amino acid transport system substrate-binding protein